MTSSLLRLIKMNMTSLQHNTPITLLICALGGEGGGVLSEWLVDVARHAGYYAQATSIPGVAQRTGATTYYIEVYPVSMADLALQGKRRPIFSLNPVPGKLDMMISSELLETARQVTNGLPAKDATHIITSSSRALTTGERMVMGDGRMDSDQLLQLIEANAARLNVLDMNAVAKDCGTIVSAVMLGAIAASGLFPFAMEDYKAVVGSGNAQADKSWRGFERAHELLTGQIKTKEMITGMLLDDPHSQISAINSNSRTNTPLSIEQIGTARMMEYQRESYAKLYAERLAAVKQATSHADSAISTNVANETARWLALWMAFDDIVRVADLKSRESRYQRVRGEVKAGDDDLVRIYDHFKPGVPEFAGLLPAFLANPMLAWDARRKQSGKGAFEVPLKVGSHGVVGMLALRFLTSLKWLRVRGSRYAIEQKLIDQWLDAIKRAGQSGDAGLALEYAKCGQLIKGYGSTNERGKDNLLHILNHLSSADDVKVAREAALKDEAGKALDTVLVARGAPAREVKAVPIQWMKRPTQ
jgi:indolepyruvate ferredoxin oxidoreductase, beta subunit